jgi:hypothetical protein
MSSMRHTAEDIAAHIQAFGDHCALRGREVAGMAVVKIALAS